jgi:hypothetical protein
MVCTLQKRPIIQAETIWSYGCVTSSSCSTHVVVPPDHRAITTAEAAAFVGNGLHETDSDDMLTVHYGVIHTSCQHPLI